MMGILKYHFGGVGVYTDEPVVEDHFSRGSQIGKRSETVA